MWIIWLTSLSLVLLAGGQVTTPNGSVAFDCLKQHNISISISYRNCNSFLDKIRRCIENSIYDSKAPFDLLFVNNVKIQNIDKAFKYVCANHDTLNTENFKCLPEVVTCADLSRLPHGCINGMISCVYFKMRTCSLRGAMIFSKALSMMKSPSCTLSSFQYNLVPFYGVDIDCYPSAQHSSFAILGPHYQHFCTVFNKAKERGQCIEDKLQTNNILDDDYIDERKEFFRQRNELCEYFSKNTSKTCPSVNVKPCQQDLFTKDARNKTFSDLLKNYIDCVYNKYVTCDATLANVIRYNLDGTKSIAAHSFVLRISQAAIVILSLLFF